MSIVGRKTPPYKILIADPLHDKFYNLVDSSLFLIEKVDGNIESYLPDADILVVRSRTEVNRDLIKKAKNLKAIIRAGNGIDNIDVEFAREKGIKVINTPEASVNAVAELTIGLIICASRMIVKANEDVKKGNWRKLLGFELAGKTLGIIGLGRIGSKVAELAKAFGMRIIAYDVRDVSERANKIGVELVSFEELLRESDIITIHVNLNEKSYHLLSYEEFEKMKDGVIIINTSRGAVIDTKALLHYLKIGKIRAAALDTLENEPPKEPWELELIRMPNVIVTPHIGASTVEAQEKIAVEVYKKIREVLVC